MLKLINTDTGMNIVGQGAKILLFAIPGALGAAALHFYAPDIAAIPVAPTLLIVLGTGLVILGAALWATAVVQLLIGFPKGKLIATGAYGVCRNPIYASFALFIIPGLSFIIGTWVYLLISAFIALGVAIFITKEEETLGQVFGAEYQKYALSVSRFIPFLRPQKVG